MRVADAAVYFVFSIRTVWQAITHILNKDETAVIASIESITQQFLDRDHFSFASN
jgi:hypothetical protein